MNFQSIESNVNIMLPSPLLNHVHFDHEEFSITVTCDTTSGTGSLVLDSPVQEKTVMF